MMMKGNDMITINPAMVYETEPHHFQADASDLGLPVGYFPPQLPTSMGNKLPFVLEYVKDNGGYFVYRQTAGCMMLTVFND